MNAQVIYEGFTHQHNPLEVASQEYEMANIAHKEALMSYDGTDPRSVARLNAAVERRSIAWLAWWKIKRGY